MNSVSARLRGLSRRAFVGGAVAVGAVSLTDALGPQAAAAGGPSAGAFGSVASAPNLPRGFGKTFTSRYVTANGLRQHVVIGGDGPPLLLIHGWPQNWYAWRLVMPELAKKYTVIAVDSRGIGLTGKPAGGYDTGSLARDVIALMDALRFERFAVVSHDVGMIIGYALAADYPDRVARIGLAEVPGPPGAVPSPEMFIEEAVNNKLWHIPFNRVNNVLTEKLVKGREEIFFGYEFDVQGGGVPLPDHAREYYFRLYSNPDVLRGGFGFYRAWDTTLKQNETRAKTRLPMPVLGIGGEKSWGDIVAKSLGGITTDLQTAVIGGAGHWVAEQAPDTLLAALIPFLEPYRAAAGSGSRS